MKPLSFKILGSKLTQRPQAWAKLSGSRAYQNLAGTVYFYQTKCGVLVAAEVSGLPGGAGKGTDGVFGFHIHNGSVCSGAQDDPFANVLTHYNPDDSPHPYHAGDLPPLFSCNGRAFLAVLTGRFCLKNVIGKTVVIHSGPDDFTTQPAGNAGNKIACGVIVQA